MRTKTLIHFSIFIGLIFISSSTIFAQNHVDNEGLKQGEWVKYKNGSKFYEGQFIDDKPIGEFLYFYPNGNIKIRTLFHEDGKMNKTKIFFNSTSEKLQAQGNYFEKKKDSTWIYYNEMGKCIAIENYSKGIKEGVFQVFNHQGILNLETYYKNDLLDGESKEYYENGAAFREINYQNGEQIGAFKIYYPEGSVLLKGKYSSNVRDSLWTTYSVDGQIEYIDYYKTGILTKRTDSIGNQIELKQEDKMAPLDVNPKDFDPTALKR